MKNQKYMKIAVVILMVVLVADLVPAVYGKAKKADKPKDKKKEVKGDKGGKGEVKTEGKGGKVDKNKKCPSPPPTVAECKCPHGVTPSLIKDKHKCEVCSCNGTAHGSTGANETVPGAGAQNANGTTGQNSSIPGAGPNGAGAGNTSVGTGAQKGGNESKGGVTGGAGGSISGQTASQGSGLVSVPGAGGHAGGAGGGPTASPVIGQPTNGGGALTSPVGGGPPPPPAGGPNLGAQGSGPETASSPAVPTTTTTGLNGGTIGLRPLNTTKGKGKNSSSALHVVCHTLMVVCVALLLI